MRGVLGYKNGDCIKMGTVYGDCPHFSSFLFLTASFILFVSTPYSSAMSESSITSVSRFDIFCFGLLYRRSVASACLCAFCYFSISGLRLIFERR